MYMPFGRALAGRVVIAPSTAFVSTCLPFRSYTSISASSSYSFINTDTSEVVGFGNTTSDNVVASVSSMPTGAFLSLKQIG